MWLTGLPVGLIALAVGGLFLYVKWPDRPTVQTEFFGLHLSDVSGDVKFLKGEPTVKEESDLWA
jgi:hypothetical protein